MMADLLTFTEFAISGPTLSLTRLKGLVMDSTLNNTELIRFYEYTTVCACELDIREQDKFLHQYSNRMRSVVQFHGLLNSAISL